MNVVMLRAPAVSEPAAARLAALHPLDDAAMAALDAEIGRAWTERQRRELLREGGEIKGARLLLDGWAARVRLLADGRRQIMSFVLPGDLIGLCEQDQPVASSTVTALTPVSLCAAPDASVSPALGRAYAVSRALEEAHLLGQITRLGRMSAHERIVDLFLELLERLELAGLAAGGRYAFPLTQEVLADVLGLTSVHVNRTLQQARRAGELSWCSREIVLHDPEALRRAVGRQPVRVSAR